MEFNMFMITIPLFRKALKNLKAILNKTAIESEHKSFELDYLLNFRLFPDQYPFYRQIRIASIEAKNSVSALTGIEAPKFKKNEASIKILNNYIDTTLDFLESINPSDFKDSSQKQIPISFKPGKYLTGFEYITEMVLPNFYFHVTTAYSILRHNGITLGKKDYLGELSFKVKA